MRIECPLSCVDAASSELSTVELSPHKVDDTLAFMFETRLPVIASTQTMALPTLQDDYDDVWNGIERHFGGEAK